MGCASDFAWLHQSHSEGIDSLQKTADLLLAGMVRMLWAATDFDDV
jgi:hypothetical protein